MNKNYHTSVLLKETIDLLSIERGSKYIDSTLGGGGHTKVILDHGGTVLGIDADEDSINFVKENLKGYENLSLAQGNFANIDKIARENGFENAAGIVMDLGVSSHQIDDETRGFSYLREGPLDMRMDKNSQVKAADLLNILTKGELYETFIKYGQEPRSRAISNSIIESRRVKAFEKTSDLTKIVEEAYGVRGEIDMKRKAQINNRVFQALRIAVNDELNVLSEALPKAVSVLSKKGRLVVITFHSLEDKIVKHSFLEMQGLGLGIVITKKPIVPAFVEMTENRRSKSAKLRVFEKI